MKALDEIRARLNAASGGKWDYWDRKDLGDGVTEAALKYQNQESLSDIILPTTNSVSGRGTLMALESDFEFIAHAPTDVQRLILAVERYEKALHDIIDHCETEAINIAHRALAEEE